MSLPTAFTTSDDYFKGVLGFFDKYQSLYKIANIEILLHNILDEVKVENLENEEVFRQDFDLADARNNNYLREFFEDYLRFKVDYDEFDESETLESTVIESPLCFKKKHEVIYLAKEIKQFCYQNRCEVVVDFGSGLGYLDQLLYETTNLKILGIECNKNIYVGAKMRQRKHHIDSLEHVKYLNHTINKDSDKNIQEHVTGKFGISNFCITGLHACADLAIDGLTLFLKMAAAKGCILMSCCYHRMVKEGLGFNNFPLSDCLKRHFTENNSHEFLGVPFLRLGAQPPNRNENLEDLVFNLLSRATLQFYVDTHGFKVKRNKRKAVRIKTVNRDFSEYIKNIKIGFTISQDITTQDEEVLQNTWREIQKWRLNAAIFILLQRKLQPLIENFILYDRLVFLKEKGINHCYVKKIFNEKVSPKCLALIGLK